MSTESLSPIMAISVRLSIQFTQPFGYHLIRQVIALCGDYEPQALCLLLPAQKIAYQRLYAALGELCPFKKGYEVIVPLALKLCEPAAPAVFLQALEYALSCGACGRRPPPARQSTV